VAAEFRFRVDDVENEPKVTMCSGCRRRLRVRIGDPNYQYAYSEDTDVFGRRRYWCRACTADQWKKLEAVS
jgi:hypothetical protein